MKLSITLGDILLLTLVVAATVASFSGTALLANGGSVVVVELKGAAVYKGNLDEDRKVTVRGEHGDVRIQIRGGMVAVVGADCPNKVCVRTGWRSSAGESIICVPNRVVIRVTGEENPGVRGVTG